MQDPLPYRCAAGGSHSHLSWGVAGAIWLLMVACGMAYLMRHEQTPGEAAHPSSARWPTGTVAATGGAGYTVAVFVHPRCPCTRASLRQLARIAAAAPGRDKLHVFFMMPTGADATWRQGENWTLAAAIPGARLYDDYDGRQATAFGAKTSGQVFIYDRDGAMRFQGGITDGRGQDGESAALTAAVQLVRADVTPAGVYPVFGCPLHDEAAHPASLPGKAR